MVRFQVFLVLPILIFGFYPSFSTPASTISINYPQQNGYLSINSLSLSGFYTSPDQNPTITIQVDNQNTTASLNSGTWSTPIYTLDNGWHNVKAYMKDSNDYHTTMSKFLIVTGHLTTTKYPVIFVLYSQVCERLISINDYSSCPPLTKLIPLDTSNQRISGYFIQKDDGTYVRQNPQIKNHFTFYYNNTDKIVCVECNPDLARPDTVQIIYLEPHAFNYINKNYYSENQTNTSKNSTVFVNYNAAEQIVHYDRYVDGTCNTANLVYSEFLLQDTINYMKSGCTMTEYNKTSLITPPYHEKDFKNSIWYNYKKYLDQSKQLISNKCLIPENCTNPQNPQNNFIGVWNTAKIKT